MCRVWCAVAVGALLLLLAPGSLEIVLEDRAQQSRWDEYELQGQNIFSNFKRHSDGTFTSDFTRYLDKIKAKDFVQWLASTKRESLQRRQLRQRVRETVEQLDYPLAWYDQASFGEGQ